MSPFRSMVMLWWHYNRTVKWATYAFAHSQKISLAVLPGANRYFCINMTLYYTLCFALLVCEISLFAAIVCPMPFAMKKKMIHFLSENPVVAKIQYGLKITFIFVALLFLDALQRMFKVAQEGQTAKQDKGVQDIRVETNHSARKFYAQRNLYLTGATLFLSLLLARVFSIVLDLITVQDELNVLKTKTAKSSTSSLKSADAEARIKELEQQLRVSQAKDRDFESLKKQAGQQAQEYDRLAGEAQKAANAGKDKKSD